MALRITSADERPERKGTAIKTTALWLLAGLITIGSAFYQRVTGPTYPVRGQAVIGAGAVSFRLPRSAGSVRDFEIHVRVPDPAVSGRLEFKPLGSAKPPLVVSMDRRGEFLTGLLPKQPRTGKLEYRVILSREGRETSLSGETAVVIRFKGAVPAAVLIAHVLIMFAGMIFSTRAGLEAAARGRKARAFAIRAFGLLFAGGMILGPIVQKLAFGAFWTGLPLGNDLTDTKTLAIIGLWAAALVAGRKSRPARGWILAASIATLLVYLIPHSLLGS